MRAFFQAWEIVQTPFGQFKARAKCQVLLTENVDQQLKKPLVESDESLEIVQASIRRDIELAQRSGIF
jgi:hypothetical protein